MRARPGQTRAVCGAPPCEATAPLAASGKRERGFEFPGSPLSSGAPTAAPRWSGGISALAILWHRPAGMFSASD
eukprot:5053114-Prymnesium_polylepis.1